MSVRWPRPRARRAGCRPPGAGRPAPRRPRDAVHRGVRGVRRAALAGAARVRRTRRRRRGPALAVAGVPPRTGSLGRRALARARDPRRAPRARHRRAQPAPARAQPSRRAQRPFRGLRHRRGADRRGRRDHAGDRTPAAQVRGVHAGRDARRSGAGALRRLRGGVRRRAARARRSACGWWITALLHNGHGRYGEALADARQACEHEDVMVCGWALVELIEAGVRVGRPDEAAAALDRLSERTRASGTEWALGIEARCRALLSDDESALPRVDRAARAQPRGGRARAQPAPVRGVAATREPAHGRARAPARRPRELQPDGSRGVRRARPPRAARPRARPCAGSPRTRATP